MIDPLSSLETLATDQANRISRTWWILLLYGLFSVAIGLLILSENWTLGRLAVFIGFFLIVEGIFTATTPSIGTMRWWMVALGIISIAVGIAALVWPGRTLFILAELVGAWIVVKGIFNIISAVANRHVVHYWWLMLLLGIVQVPIGMWLLRRPGLTLYAVIILVGIWLVVQGSILAALSFEVKNLPRIMARRRAAAAATPLGPS